MWFRVTGKVRTGEVHQHVKSLVPGLTIARGPKSFAVKLKRGFSKEEAVDRLTRAAHVKKVIVSGEGIVLKGS